MPQTPEPKPIACDIRKLITPPPMFDPNKPYALMQCFYSAGPASLTVVHITTALRQVPYLLGYR